MRQRGFEVADLLRVERRDGRPHRRARQVAEQMQTSLQARVREKARRGAVDRFREWIDALVQLACGHEIVALHRAIEFDDQLRHHRRETHERALGAHGEARHQMLVARRHHRDVRRERLHEPAIRLITRGLPTALLDRDDVRQRDQRRQHLRRVRHRARAHARLIEHQRQLGVRVRDAMVRDDRREVGGQRPRVRRKQQQRVGACRFRIVGMRLRLIAVLGIDTGDDDRLRAAHLAGDLHHAPLFLARKREVFTGMTIDQESDYSVDGRDLREMTAQRIFVEVPTVGVERAQRGGVDAMKRKFANGNHGIGSR
ncbi:hypothetical protein PSP6_280082 [Paraburkholderia tropica]|nr:hypothetical protein PSP6_280082 [Paraburkholderia tropica]